MPTNRADAMSLPPNVGPALPASALALGELTQIVRDTFHGRLHASCTEGRTNGLGGATAQVVLELKASEAERGMARQPWTRRGGVSGKP